MIVEVATRCLKEARPSAGMAMHVRDISQARIVEIHEKEQRGLGKENNGLCVIVNNLSLEG